VYLPDDAQIKVAVGDKVRAGSSVIGRFAMPESGGGPYK
jgi:hypothetical protein